MEKAARPARRSGPRLARTGKKAKPADAFTIGRDGFERISAVERIRPTQEARARTAEFDRKGLSPDERIRAIVEAHRPQR